MVLNVNSEQNDPLYTVVNVNTKPIMQRALAGAASFFGNLGGGSALPAFHPISSLPSGGGGGFGGDGSDGAVVITTDVTGTKFFYLNATDFTVGDGGHIYASNGCVINATGAVTIGGGVSGLIDVANSDPGGAGSRIGLSTPTAATPSAGIAGGGVDPSYTAGSGGAGGSCGGYGGNGGTAASTTTSAQPQPTTAFSDQSNSWPTQYGSGGGGGIADSGFHGGFGGDGGGRLTICAVGAVTFGAGALIDLTGGFGGGLDGGNGQTGATSAGGGGGGSGGVILIASQTSIDIQTASVNTSGGNGGNGKGTGAGGGGGSGGVVFLWAPSITIDGTPIVSTSTFAWAGNVGGAAGTDGAGFAGGNSGVGGDFDFGYALLGTPNLPLPF